MCSCSRGSERDALHSDTKHPFVTTSFLGHVATNPSLVAGKQVAKTVSIRPVKRADSTAEVEEAKGSHKSAEQQNRDNRIQHVSSSASNSALTDPFAGTELALIFGDSWIVATTFLTSSLFPMKDIPVATAAVVSCWVLAGLVRGDYKFEEDEDTAWLPGWTVYTGILAGCFTWLFSTPLVLLSYSVLVSHGWLDANPIMVIEEGSKVSPALEIQVALLIVMTAWRGLYYAFRDGVI